MRLAECVDENSVPERQFDMSDLPCIYNTFTSKDSLTNR